LRSLNHPKLDGDFVSTRREIAKAVSLLKTKDQKTDSHFAKAASLLKIKPLTNIYNNPYKA